MTFCYVPILKWKQGEQTSLKEFPNDLRECILPVIEFLPLKVPSGHTLASTFNSELPRLVKLLKAAKFDANAVGIDTSLFVKSGELNVKLLASYCGKLVANGIKAIPVIHPQMIFHSKADLNKLEDFEELILRIKPTTLIPEQVQHLVATYIEVFGRRKPLHVVLDAHDIVGFDPTSLARVIDPYIVLLQGMKPVVTITFAGGSFPMSMQGISQGTTKIDRVEWHTYQQLIAKFPDLRFGDYSVTNPVLLEVEDPTKLNPSVQIRYTRANDWMIMKAGGARTSGWAQYNALCKLLIVHKDYLGPTYSYGDQKYMDYAQPGATSGNFMTWRRDATSHHIVFTTRQLKA